MRVTRSYLARMRRGDVDDPLLRQVLPLADELVETPGYGSDPLQEHEATRAPGSAAEIRRARAAHHHPGLRHSLPLLLPARVPVFGSAARPRKRAPRRFRAALDVIAGDTSIEEVILSGGDPLSLSDARLTKITDAIAGMRHVQRIRVHTRQPIVLPSRVDGGLLTWLRGIQRPTVFVLHTNHPNEIDGEVRAACAKLRAAGVTLLNQSVLLRGVNDDVDTLAQLSRALMDAGVVPYYLHLPDRVRGTAHFDVAEAEAQRLVDALERPAVRLPRAAAGARSSGRAVQGAERRNA